MTEETRKPRSDTGKRRALTNVQRRDVFKMLETHGATSGGWWEYDEDWSDEKIAGIIDCGIQQVASIRRDCFGDLKPTPPADGGIMPVLWNRIKVLEAQVEAIQNGGKGAVRVKDLEHRIAALEAQLNDLSKTPAAHLAKVVGSLKEEWADHRHRLMEINGRLNEIEAARPAQSGNALLHLRPSNGA